MQPSESSGSSALVRLSQSSGSRCDCVVAALFGNAVGTGVNVSLPPAVEPGILPKKKKKKGVVMGMISRKIQENDDNNNIILKQILDGIDKVDVAIDTQHQKKENIEFIEAK
ncbi:MAG: hypothetical protein ACKPKO_02440, partial [Candidatus Fonsibacter sp.]